MRKEKRPHVFELIVLFLFMIHSKTETKAKKKKKQNQGHRSRGEGGKGAESSIPKLQENLLAENFPRTPYKLASPALACYLPHPPPPPPNQYKIPPAVPENKDLIN